MMTGTVTDVREIVIHLQALSVSQLPVSFSAVVDTGFNGFLTLQANTLIALEASSAGTRRAELGDGKIIEMDSYFVKIKWHDKVREILVLQAEGTPLVGMSLLWGSRVAFEARADGPISIEKIQSP